MSKKVLEILSVGDMEGITSVCGKKCSFNAYYIIIMEELLD
jgi:hypothetical protein